MLAGEDCYRVEGKALLGAHNMSTGGNPSTHGTPKPVSLAHPGKLSDADYAQLSGLTPAEKIRHLRGILNQVQATRISPKGSFVWIEGVGLYGEHLFIGPAPLGSQFYTVVVIEPNGDVWKMQPVGIKGVVSQGPPQVFDFDLRMGNGVLMVKLRRSRLCQVLSIMAKQ